MRAWTFVLVLACASAASAQSAPGPAAGSVFVGASLGGQRFNQLPEDRRCAPSGNRGIFCGGVTGVTPVVTGTAGLHLIKYISLAVEGALSKSRQGSVSYDGYSHVDYDLTSGTYERSTEQSVSILLRGYVETAPGGVSVEPVFGFVGIRATDRLLDQVNVIGRSPSTTRLLPNAETSRSAKGFQFGVDAASPPRHGVSFTGAARIRWANWPPTMTHYYSTAAPQVVPVAVGQWVFSITAGVRWTRVK